MLVFRSKISILKQFFDSKSDFRVENFIQNIFFLARRAQNNPKAAFRIKKIFQDKIFWLEKNPKRYCNSPLRFFLCCWRKWYLSALSVGLVSLQIGHRNDSFALFFLDMFIFSIFSSYFILFRFFHLFLFSSLHFFRIFSF